MINENRFKKDLPVGETMPSAAAEMWQSGAVMKWKLMQKLDVKDLRVKGKKDSTEIKDIVKKIVKSLIPSESYAIIHHDQAFLMNIVATYTQANTDHKALVFTRTRPSIMVERNRISRNLLKKIDMFWLSTMITSQEKTISPTELPKINREIIEFLTNAGKNGLILFDGLEYLSIHNGFEATLKFMQSIRDFVSLHLGTIIYVIDPLAFSEKEQHLIFRELTFIDVD